VTVQNPSPNGDVRLVVATPATVVAEAALNVPQPPGVSGVAVKSMRSPVTLAPATVCTVAVSGVVTAPPPVLSSNGEGAATVPVAGVAVDVRTTELFAVCVSVAVEVKL
jgi:hypothetical protein